MTRTVLITGATGGLGRPLVARALAEGYKVVAVGRNSAALDALDGLGVETIRGDLRNVAVMDSIAARLRKADVDVIHAAALSVAYADPALVRAHNVAPTRALVEAFMRTAAGRFVFISSPSVLLRPRDQWSLAEDARLPARGYTAYAESKIQGEALVRRLGRDAVIIRPRALYGPGETTLLPRLMAAASQGRLPLLRGGEAITQLTWMDDAVEGIWRALTARAAGGETLHLAGEDHWTVRDLIETACSALGIAPRFVPLPTSLARTLAWTGEHQASLFGGHTEPRLTRHAVATLAWTQTYDTDKARRLLGWRSTVGLTDTLEQVMAALPLSLAPFHPHPDSPSSSPSLSP